jgi:hypothetical protein
LFFPDGPRELFVLFKILSFLGYRYTSDPHWDYQVAIKWWLAFDGNPFAPETSDPLLNTIQQRGVPVINIRCKSISKANVTATFEEIFGYSLAVDPSTHRGKCVAKTNWNGLHLAAIIDCPTKPRHGDFVYQKLVRNEVKDGLVEDMRVPIFRHTTPFVYLKYRPAEHRFVDRSHVNSHATIAEVADVLSATELQGIYRFCDHMGLDYGELDVLRDRDDGRIYIVDVNNTPSGPTSAIGTPEGKIAVARLARAFAEAFGV